MAESLWVDARRATLRPEFVERARACCQATATALNFSAPDAVARINAWVSGETHGRVTHIVERIDRADLAMLLSAVYLKGQWSHPFDKAQTAERDFVLDGGTVKRVPRMVQTRTFEYFETPQLQAVRLSFGDGALAMEVLLPAKGSTLRELERQLTDEHWTNWKARYAERPGTLELPRFELTQSQPLNDALQTLGMTRIFERDGAQVTGMFAAAARSQAGHFFIGSVLQAIYWKVDEEGVEAAAVTSISVHASARVREPEPFRMSVDRPFFCAIEDRQTGALLFIGGIHDPVP
jgi:serpin B